jgi:hypothetical protein
MTTGIRILQQQCLSPCGRIGQGCSLFDEAGCFIPRTWRLRYYVFLAHGVDTFEGFMKMFGEAVFSDDGAIQEF